MEWDQGSCMGWRYVNIFFLQPILLALIVWMSFSLLILFDAVCFHHIVLILKAAKFDMMEAVTWEVFRAYLSVIYRQELFDWMILLLMFSSLFSWMIFYNYCQLLLKTCLYSPFNPKLGHQWSNHGLCWRLFIDRTTKVHNPSSIHAVVTPFTFFLDFICMLSQCHVVDLDNKTVQLFLSRPIAKDFLPLCQPVYIFPTSWETEQFNGYCLSCLASNPVAFKSHDWITAKHTQHLLETLLVKSIIKLKIGIQVILVWNIDNGLMNGTISTVKGFYIYSRATGHCSY